MQQCCKEKQIINLEKWWRSYSLPGSHLFAEESRVWKSKTTLLFTNYYLSLSGLLTLINTESDIWLLCCFQIDSFQLRNQ